jgi:hypothetical protein
MIVLGGLLGALLMEYHNVHRTYAYDSAIYLAEAGVEEGIAMLNYGGSSWAGNGWSSVGGNTNYIKTVTNLTPIGSSSSIGSYTVSIYGVTGINPTITCTGIVNVTSATYAGSTATNMIRAVRVIVKRRTLFRYGIQAKTSVSISNGSVDSFDSSDPAYSANFDSAAGYGTYTNAPGKWKDNGDIAANSTNAAAIALGNGLVYGHANTGAGGTVTVGSSGFLAAIGSATNGVIDTSRVSHTMSVTPPDGALPSDFSAVSNLGSYGGGNLVGGATSPVDYVATSVTISGGNVLNFTSGYVRLYCQGDFTTSGSGYIHAQPGTTVEIYVDGKIVTSGSGIVNDAQRASSFSIVALGNDTVTISGSAAMYCTIYAPKSAVTISGSGSLIGAIVGNTFSLSGGMHVHYDEALRGGSGGQYAVMSWQEL